MKITALQNSVLEPFNHHVVSYFTGFALILDERHRWIGKIESNFFNVFVSKFKFCSKFFTRDSVIVIDKIESSSDENIMQSNATIVREGNRSLMTIYYNVLTEIKPPIFQQLNIKYSSKDQAFDKTIIDININMCSIFVMKGRNPIFDKVYEYSRKFGKVFDRCPLKKV
jgi:Protein of unknown function (DUF1091)